jgi:hypothetical protein
VSGESDASTLLQAISDFSFPTCVFDFSYGVERVLPSMSAVETVIHDDLRSEDRNRVRDGLANIVYWGWARAGFRNARVQRLRERVSDDQLDAAIEAFRTLQGVGLTTLKRLRLPEFSNLSFLSKLRTFLDPHTFCVIDLKLCKINSVRDQFERRTRKTRYLPVNRVNVRSYEWWVDLCRRVAQALSNAENLRAVDVERGFFQLVDTGRVDVADRLIRTFR